MMNDHSAQNLRELNEALRGWIRRQRVQRGLVWSARGMAAGLLITLIGWAPLRLLPAETALLAAALACVGALTVGMAAFAWRISPLDAARKFDRLFRLQERCSTALEIAERREDNMLDLHQRQIADAADAASQIDARKLLPLRAPRWEAALIGALLVALPLSHYLSRSYIQAIAQQRQVEQLIREETGRVEAAIEKIERDNQLNAEQKAEITEPLREAAETLRSTRSLEQAVSALNKAGRALQEPGNGSAQEALQSAGEMLGQRAGTQLEALANAMEQGNADAAAEQLRNIDPTTLVEADRRALGDALEAASQGTSASDPALAEALHSAAEALRSEELRSEASLREAEESRQALDAAAQALEEGLHRQEVIQAAASEAEFSRQRLVEASSARSGLEGASGEEQADAPGAGSGSGASAGSGAADSAGGAGRGEAGDQPATGGEAGDRPISQGNAPGDGGERPYEALFPAQRLGGEGGTPLLLPQTGGQGELIAAPSSSLPGGDSTSLVPYQQIFSTYQQVASQAIETGAVPVQLRDLVREYFTALEP